MTKVQIKDVLEFLQYVIDQWELDTAETQNKALELLNRLA